MSELSEKPLLDPTTFTCEKQAFLQRLGEAISILIDQRGLTRPKLITLGQKVTGDNYLSLSTLRRIEEGNASMKLLDVLSVSERSP